VSLAEVAEAVGITAPAVYRHYRNKQDLLLASVQLVIDAAEEVASSADGLADFLRSLAALTVEQRGLAAIWQRESRHLDIAQRRLVIRRAVEMVSRLGTMLRDERPELPESDHALLAVAVIGIFTGRGDSRATSSRHRYEELLYELAAAAAHCELGRPEQLAFAPDDRAAQGQAVAGVRIPRREVLLNAAIRLFDQRGFHSVRLGDVAESAGIVRSGTYRYFANKTELLVAATRSGSDRIRVALGQALAQAGGPEQALELFVRAYIAVMIDDARLMGVIVNDRHELPDDERKRLDRFLSDYDDMWLQALVNAAPGVDPAEARVAVQSTRAMIYFVVRWGPYPRRADLAERLTEIAMATLLPHQAAPVSEAYVS
jgi:AcrR family transcriptional regulator